MTKRNKRSRAQKLWHQRRRMGWKPSSQDQLSASKQVAGFQVAIPVQTVRASHSQSDQRYPLSSRNYQSSCMSVTFLAYENEGCEFTTPALDRVLVQGDSLYAEAKHHLILQDAFQFDHLALEDMPDQVLTDTRVYNFCIPEVRCGPLKPQAASDGSWYMPLVRQLDCLSRGLRHALLVVDSQCFAVFCDMSGRHGIFDPHPRNAEGLPDCDGTAIMKTFPDVSGLADHLYRLLADHPRSATFQFVPILFQDVVSGDHLEQPSAGNVSRTVFRRMAAAIADLWACPLQRSLQRSLQKTNNTEEQPTYGKRRRTSEEYRMKRREADRYRTDADFRNRQRQYFRDRYRTAADFRNRQRQYCRDRYRTDADFRNRRKQYMRDRYRTDPDFRKRQKQYMAERRRSQKAEKLLLSLFLSTMPVPEAEREPQQTAAGSGSYLRRYHSDPEFRLRCLQRGSRHSRTELATNAVFNVQDKLQTAWKIKKKYEQIRTRRSPHSQPLIQP